MTREDRILFACARQDFQPEHRAAVEMLAGGPGPAPSARLAPSGSASGQSLRLADGAGSGRIDWERLAATAERHGLLPIVGANLRRCDPAALGLPEKLAERLEVAAFENALLKERDASALAEALVRLRAAGLEAMLLKGAALDLLVYAEPWMASSHDTDLLIRPLPGRRPGPGVDALREALYRQGIECDLGEHHDVNMNGVLPIPFPRIWEDARRVRFRGQDAWVMSPEDLLISLCINSCRKRFLRLKGLFDIAETVRRLSNGPVGGLDWARLAQKARDYRCEGIVYAALHMTAATVGCELPGGVLAALRLSPARAALLRRLVAGALRTASLDGTEAEPSLLLPYASYRWGQAWRSLWVALRHRGPHPLPPSPASSTPPPRERGNACGGLGS